MKLSCIIPCYNEEQSLPFFYDELIKVYSNMPKIDLEILFIDDGSTDSTLTIIEKIREQDKRVKYISFSRNFGKEAAIFAGLNHASGEYGVIMDADLQDPPALLPEMLRYAIEEGYDIVATKRSTRKNEPIIRSFFARCFYKIINKMTTADIVDGARDFQLMSRKVIDAIVSMGEYNRFSKGIFGWVGFKKKWLEYENIERVAGTTKWSFKKLFVYAVEGMVAFSVRPLVWVSWLGILFFIVAIGILVTIFLKTLFFGDPVAGWPSLVCIIMLVTGVQLLCMGIIGQYVAKMYLETKNRPIYIISKCDTGKNKTE